MTSVMETHVTGRNNDISPYSNMETAIDTIICSMIYFSATKVETWLYVHVFRTKYEYGTVNSYSERKCHSKNERVWKYSVATLTNSYWRYFNPIGYKHGFGSTYSMMAVLDAFNNYLLRSFLLTATWLAKM